MYDIAAKLEETHKQQTDLLFGLIHVGPKLLQQFIDSTRQDLSLLRSLCNDALKTRNYAGLVDPAFHLAHTMKGNAALLDLTVYKSYATALEDQLEQLTLKKSAGSAAWVEEVLRKAGSIETILDQTESLLAELMVIQTRDDRELSATQMFLTSIRMLIDKLNRQFDKRVTLRCEHFDLAPVPEYCHESLMEIMTQLVSNAIAHGIEKPAQRQACGKFPVGMLCLQTDKVGGRVRIRVQDDGAGPNIARVKILASRYSDYSMQQIELLTNEQLVSLLFVAGLSTAEVPTDITGRGVGMGMVRQLVEQLDAQLEFRFALGQGCQFDILLPAKVR